MDIDAKHRQMDRKKQNEYFFFFKDNSGTVFACLRRDTHRLITGEFLEDNMFRAHGCCL